MNIYDLGYSLVSKTLISCGIEDKIEFTVQTPRDLSHGDLATNVAMALAKNLKQSPRALAERLVKKLKQESFVASAEVAGPGFINIRLSCSDLSSF